MLEAWFEAEEKLPRRERRTAQRIYEALCVEGYSGTVDTERRQMRAFEPRRGIYDNTKTAIDAVFMGSGATTGASW